jgi:citrate lyase subunit beta / citryl-CoA lyase
MREDVVVAPPAARRSCISVPAGAPSKLAKAQHLDADEAVIDLEDSVIADAKDEARMAAVQALGSWSRGTVSVRINAPRTPWCHLDLAAISALSELPHTVVVPKVESAGDLAFIDRLLDGLEAASGRAVPVGVQALIETAEGLAKVDDIASGSPRLQTLIIGYADLAASLGRSAAGAANLDLWLDAQERVLRAARANGLQAIDGPFLGTAVDEQFRVAAERTKDLGYDGKWAIHPAQIAMLNEIFSPTGVEITHAREVIETLARAEREGRGGAVALDGQMLDEALRRSALRVLARAGERVR